MPDDPARRPKRDALKRRGTLNPHPDVVTDPLFQTGDFFESRRSRAGQVRDASSRKSGQAPGQPVRFGIWLLPSHLLSGGSRFSARGCDGLLPEKRGPRQGHKLTSEVLDFAAQLRASDPSVRPPALVAAIQKRFAITAHPRSIERALGRQEKKRR